MTEGYVVNCVVLAVNCVALLLNCVVLVNCVVLRIVGVLMRSVLLPPGVNPIAVYKYIVLYHIISYHMSQLGGLTVGRAKGEL
jgi:hypothetical protein